MSSMLGHQNTSTSIPEVIVFDVEPSDTNRLLLQHNVVPVDVSHFAGDTNLGSVGQSSSSSEAQIAEHSLSSLGDCAGSGLSLEIRHSEPNRPHPEIVDSGRLPSLQMSCSYAISQNVNHNAEYQGRSKIESQDIGVDLSLQIFNHGTSDTDVIQPPRNSSHLPLISPGTAGSVAEEHQGKTDISSDGLHLSCKRKAPVTANDPLSVSGGSSTPDQQANHLERHAVSPQYNAPGNLSISPPHNMQHPNHPEENLNTRLWVDTGVVSDVCQSSSVAGSPFVRNTRLRSEIQQHFVSASVSSPEPAFGNFQVHSSSPTLPSSLNLRSAAASDNMTSQVLPVLNLSSSSRTPHLSAWDESGNLRGSFSPMSPDLSVNTSDALQEQWDFNNAEGYFLELLNELRRNLTQNSFDRTRGFLVNDASAPWNGSSPGVHSSFSSASFPHHNPDLFSSLTTTYVGSESGEQTSDLPSPASARIHLQRGILSRARRPPQFHFDIDPEMQVSVDQRSDRSVSQDAFIDFLMFYGMHNQQDVHDDMHEDMRLDVDNMSYEELLALEEEIGNVSTGLTGEAIIAHLIRGKHHSIKLGPPVEQCCVCQEEYHDGDDTGKLPCGHDFHYDCIKRWLTQKNSCPMCKSTAMAI